MRKIDYLIAHETACFARRHWDKFIGFLTRNEAKVATEIVKAFGKTEDGQGGAVIGRFYEEIHRTFREPPVKAGEEVEKVVDDILLSLMKRVQEGDKIDCIKKISHAFHEGYQHVYKQAPKSYLKGRADERKRVCNEISEYAEKEYDHYWRDEELAKFLMAGVMKKCKELREKLAKDK